MRLDMVLSDIERRNIRQGPFQAVADLNKHLAVLDENEQDRPVSSLLLSNAPSLRDALCVVFD